MKQTCFAGLFNDDEQVYLLFMVMNTIVSSQIFDPLSYIWHGRRSIKSLQTPS